MLIAARLCIAATPGECIEKIKNDFVPNGFSHVIFGLVDNDALQQFIGRTIANLPTMNDQIRLIHD